MVLRLIENCLWDGRLLVVELVGLDGVARQNGKVQAMKELKNRASLKDVTGVTVWYELAE